MKGIIIILLLGLLIGCSSKKEIPEILKNDFQVRIISNAKSESAINLDENHLKDILILLHTLVSPEEITKYFNLTEPVFNERINDLFSQGLIKRTEEGKFVPSCMIIDFEKGTQLKKLSDSLGKVMSGIAIDRIKKVKEAYTKIISFKNIPFESLSLFILGDVLHSYWQWRFIQERYLKADPPQRGLSRSYLSLVENSSNNKHEVFGLYTNRFSENEKYMVGYFGNQRIYINELPTEGQVNDIVRSKKIILPVISKEDQKKLYELALIITQDLLNYLEKNRPLFIKTYLNSIYKDQTTFREWFVWFYQFIITSTIEDLIKKGYIQTDVTKNTFFLLMK